MSYLTGILADDVVIVATATSTLTTTPPRSKFTYGSGSFAKVFQEDKFWVDRTSYIPVLEALDANAVVSLRHGRMGKTLWLDTLAHYYDKALFDDFHHLFGHLAIGKAPTRLANDFHILRLNFAGINFTTVDEFTREFNDVLNKAFAYFKKAYYLSFELEQSAISTFLGLVDELKRQQGKLYVLIDDYDTSINQAILCNNIRLDDLERVESMYGQFFSRIKTACDNDMARCFITGVLPLAFHELTSRLNIVEDITHNLDFAELYGFTETDVGNGLARLPQLSPDVIDWIRVSWRRDHKGYVFNPLQEVALYDPARVVHGLRQLEQVLRRDPPPSTLPPKRAAAYLLNRSLEDLNLVPAEATLNAMKLGHHATVEIELALSSKGEELKCPGGVAAQFRWEELPWARRSMLSLMFYTGALTYARSSPGSVDIKHSLRIPYNDVARQ